MSIKFNELYVDTMAKGLLEPGERLAGSTMGYYTPFFSRIFGLARFFRRKYLMLATDQRVIVIEHRTGLFYERIQSVESIPWRAVDQAKIGGLFAMKLSVKSSQYQKTISVKVPRMLAPMPSAGQRARAVVGLWQSAASTPQLMPVPS